MDRDLWKRLEPLLKESLPSSLSAAGASLEVIAKDSARPQDGGQNWKRAGQKLPRL